MTSRRRDPSVTAPPRGLVPTPDDPRLHETVEALARAGGDSVTAILLYGSHVQASSPNRWSAYDFLLITDSYRTFFRRMVAGGHHSKPPWLLTVLSHILSPNVISFSGGDETGPPAKCAVLTPRHLRRALKPRSPDHFIKGRVVQKLALVWSRGPEDEERVISALKDARAGIVRWVRPFLRGSFDLEQFAETMLRVSYRGEIRPESPDRVMQVFESQKETLVGIAGEALSLAERNGLVVQKGRKYRWTRKPTRVSWLFYTSYFAISKARATARWFKYMITFEGWLDYIQRKIERRGGFEVEIEERERRWPLIFLWPKLFLVLRNLKNRSPSSTSEEESESA